MSTAPIYYFRDTKTGADVNAIAGSDANDGLSDATAKQTYETEFLGNLFDSATAGTRFRFARGCGFSQALDFRLNNLNSTVTVTSITLSGSTATATTGKIHNLEVGDTPNVTGCDQSEYNIAAVITSVPTTTTFTYEVVGNPATPATTSSTIRQDASMIYIEEYTSSEFTPAVDAKPYCTYTNDLQRQHRFDRDGMEGYSFKNMHYEYTGTLIGTPSCFYFYNLAKDTFIFDDLIMDSYRIGMDVNRSLGQHVNIQLVNSTIKNCWSQGWLGGCDYSLIDNNIFINNGHNVTGGDATLHNVYLTYITNSVFSNNNLYQSAMNAGLATSSSITVHGDSSKLTIEDNYIHEDIGACGSGAYGIAVNTGYTDAETFSDIIIRRNKVENMGNTDILISSNIRTIIENNIIIQNQPDFGSIACIAARAATQGTGNANNTDCIIRNNSISGSNVSTFIQVSEGTGFTIVSNSGHSTSTGVVDVFDLPLSIIDTTNYDVVDNNVFYAPVASTFNYDKTVTGDLVAWQAASIFSDNDQVADPLYRDVANNDLSVGFESPLTNAGHTSLSSISSYDGITRSIPDIGAYEYNMKLNTNVVWLSTWDGTVHLNNILKVSHQWEQRVGVGAFTYPDGKLTPTVATDEFSLKLCDQGISMPSGTYTLVNPSGHEIGVGNNGSPAYLAYTTATEITFEYTTGNGIWVWCKGLSGLTDSNTAIIIPDHLADHKAGKLWNRAMLDYLRGLNITSFRAMDLVNASANLEIDWVDRQPVDSVNFYNLGFRKLSTLPWEYVIDLANTLDIEPWLCIPHRATDAYVDSLAQLIQANLNIGLNFKVELGNEIWNSGDPWGDGRGWIQNLPHTKVTATADDATNTFTSIAHGFTTNDRITSFSTKENRIAGLIIDWRMSIGQEQWVNVLTVDTFQIIDASGGTVVPITTGMVNLIYTRSAEAVQDRDEYYGTHSVSWWDILETYITPERVKKVIAVQNGNPDTTLGEFSAVGVAGRADYVSPAPYFKGLWWGTQTDLVTTAATPKVWVNASGYTVHSACYASGLTPTNDEIKAGTGSIAFDSVVSTGTSSIYDSLAQVTGLSDGSSYEMFFLLVDANAYEWIIQSTFTAAVSGSIDKNDSDANQAIRNRIDIDENMIQLATHRANANNTPMITYESGIHFHEVAPTGIELWIEAYVNSTTFTTLYDYYINEMSVAGIEENFHFKDISSNSQFAYGNSYDDVLDPRYVGVSAHNGYITQPDDVIVADTLATQLTDPITFPHVIHTFGSSSLTYTLISGNGDGIFDISGDTLRVIDDTNVVWSDPTVYSLVIEADDGVVSDFFNIDIGLGDSWYPVDAVIAFSSIDDTTSIEMNPTVGNSIPLTTSTGSLVANGLWDLSGNTYSGVSSSPNIDFSIPWLFAITIDLNGFSDTFSEIIKLRTSSSGSFIALITGSGILQYNVYSTTALNNNQTLGAVGDFISGTKYVVWGYYDGLGNVQIGVDQTNVLNAAIDLSDLVSATHDISVNGGLTSVKLGSYEMLSRVGLTLVEAKEYVQKLQDYHADGGKLSDEPVDYYGFTQVDGTSINIDSISYINSYIGETAPYVVMASANVTTTGTRRNSALPINDYENIEYRWTLTYANGLPVEYFDDIWSQTDLAFINPNTDTNSPEFTCIIRKEGTYRINVEARISSNVGKVWYDFYDEIITIGANTQSHLYYDVVSGLDANDGLDPNGFALTTGVYTELTGYLVETAAFTAYDHTVATSYGYDRENTNWIYVDGALRRIAAKIDNDTIQLDTVYKLGIDKTALTSSNGTKQNFSGAAVGGTDIHLKGGTTTDMTSAFSANGYTTNTSLMSYATGKATITSTSIALEESVIPFFTNASGQLPPKCTISNILVDGASRVSGIGGAAGSTSDVSQTTILIDRCKVINVVDSNNAGSIGNFQTVDTKQMDVCLWANEIISSRTRIDNYTISIADIDGTTVTVNEVIGGTTLPVGTIRIFNGTDYDYYIYDSYAGSVFTLGAALGLPGTLGQTYALNTSVISSERKGNTTFTGLGSLGHLRYIGNIVDAVSDAIIYDHVLYPSNKTDHQHMAWSYARNCSHIGYMYNTNFEGTGTVNYFSIHDNYASGVEWFCDASNGNNDPTLSNFDNMVVTRNKADSLVKGFWYSYCGKSFFAKGNSIWGIITSNDIFHTNVPATGVIQSEWKYVLEGNNVYGNNPLIIMTSPIAGLELYNNNVVTTSIDQNIIDIDDADVTNLYVDQNTVFAPNDTDGDYLALNGVTKTLAEFDAIAGGTNLLRSPNWTDGANGDFTPTTTPSVVSTQNNITGTIGLALNYDVGVSFIGVSPITYTLGTGTLPSGLVLNPSTGFISGTPTTVETQTGISITATNSYGNITNATFTIGISAYTLNWASNAYGTLNSPDLVSGYQAAIIGTGYYKFKYASTTTQAISSGPSNNCTLLTTGFSFRHTFGTTTVFTVPDFENLYLDNSIHTVEFDWTEGLVRTMILDGVSYDADDASVAGASDFVRIENVGGSTTGSYTGKHYDIDLFDGTNNVVYNVVSGSTISEPASVGNGIVTFTNVVTNDWPYSKGIVAIIIRVIRTRFRNFMRRGER